VVFDFTVRYGVISRHFGKDVNHNISVDQWKQLCGEITRPFAIAKYKDGFRLFINLKINNNWTAVGVNVKNPARDLEINAVSTVFGYKEHGGGNETFVYVSPEITPGQTALLDRLNSCQYPSARRRDTPLSDTSEGKSSNFSSKGQNPGNFPIFFTSQKNPYPHLMSIRTDTPDDATSSIS
jgi:hypothetical protein